MTACRILHVVGAMDRAGAETMIMNLYREIDRTRYQFDFICFNPGPNDFDAEIVQMGGHIIRLDATNPIRRFGQLFRVLRKGCWRIVHSHTLFSSGLHLLAAKLAGVPKRIVHSHSTSSRVSQSVADRLYARAMFALLSSVPTHYISCGDAAARHLFGHQNDVMILPNAIDIDSFVTASPPEDADSPVQGKPDMVILQVGRLEDVKNHDVSIAIAKELKRRSVDFKMVFVGEGSRRAALEDTIARNDLIDHVIMAGLRKDIASLMAMADIMLMPSLFEGFPVVLVESQAVGLPAVISDTISNEVDLGLGLVDFVGLAESSETWADRIVTCAGRDRVLPERRRDVIAAKGFSASRSAATVADFYQNL